MYSSGSCSAQHCWTLTAGYLTVGGENSVGRGRATITALTLNGYPLQKEDLLHALTEVENEQITNHG